MSSTPREFYGPGEGEDRLEEGTNPAQLEFVTNVPVKALYQKGSAHADNSGVTASSLYPFGIPDGLARPAVHPELLAPLQKAHESMAKNGRGLAVVGGLLTPANQRGKWKALYDKYVMTCEPELLLVQKVLKAGRKAFTTGSVAQLRESPELQSKVDQLVGYALDRVPKYMGAETPELAREFLMFLSNADLQTNRHFPTDKFTTDNSVHNLGCSVNVVPIYTNGEDVALTGVGVDLVCDAQRADYFEHATADEYRALVAAEPLLAEYLSTYGVELDEINERLIAEIADNRWELHTAMRDAGFSGYKGESGHYTFIPESGLPSRENVYKQAAKMGIKIFS